MFDRSFGSLFWGKLLTVTGTLVQSIVAAIVVFEATDSALMVGLVSVFQFGPQLLLTPLAGKWADTYSAFKQVLAGRGLCFVGSVILAVWAYLVPDPDSGRDVVPVFFASCIIGLGFVVGGPVMQSMIPRMIRPGELSKAMALNSSPMTIGRVAGPAVGALLTVHFGAVAAFSVAVFTQLAFLILLFFIRFPAQPERLATTDYSVRAGLRHVWSDRTLLMLLAVTAALGFASEPSVTLAPPLADHVGGSARLVGELSSAFGLGALLGLVLLSPLGRWLSHAAITSLGIWIMAVGLVLSAVSTVAPMATASFAVAGFGFMAAFTAAATLIQERVPDVLRGRVMALWLIAFIGFRPIGAAIDGVLADVVSVEFAFAVSAALLALTGVWWRPGRAAASVPDPAATPAGDSVVPGRA
ncbi:MFS transporter [Aeromicrobium yanjiei]|uniref:MFS transporter n=1 Tax=Aeromicrobium yanjiei TaxID=2662028 RepID=A0A5Q2MII3_9ACTN|nr:MFS transporter [Aeromicrobium yanjiei]QGG41571.1 MFS transporter [Aeromicrobium yanjiei]